MVEPSERADVSDEGAEPEYFFQALLEEPIMIGGDVRDESTPTSCKGKLDDS